MFKQNFLMNMKITSKCQILKLFFVLIYNLNSSAADVKPVSSTAAAATPALLLLYSAFESSAGLERKPMLEHKLESFTFESMSIGS